MSDVLVTVRCPRRHAVGRVTFEAGRRVFAGRPPEPTPGIVRDAVADDDGDGVAETTEILLSDGDIDDDAKPRRLAVWSPNLHRVGCRCGAFTVSDADLRTAADAGRRTLVLSARHAVKSASTP